MSHDGVRRNVTTLMRYPDVTFERLAKHWPELAAIPGSIALQLSIDARYSGYLNRQEADIAAFQKEEAVHIPRDLNIESIKSLSNEVKEKIRTYQPQTLGQARRIPGMTPAAIVAIKVHLDQAHAAQSHAPNATLSRGRNHVA